MTRIEDQNTPRLCWPELPYVYKPLLYSDSIRLIKLEPRESGFSDQLTCELLDVRLSETPDFEAISYAWEAAVFPDTLHILKEFLKITSSLASALRKFQDSNEPRLLWADAVCINQSDVPERSSQVALMHQIYGNAKQVLVWLGPGDERTGNVFSLLERFGTASSNYGVDPLDLKDRLPWIAAKKATPAQTELLDQIPQKYDLSGMDEFYSLPWFRRLWVVQEITLARHIVLHCGGFETLWTILVRAAIVQYRCVWRATLSNLRLPKNFDATIAIETARRTYAVNSNQPLFGYLKALRLSLCSNDLDRIYSLLAISRIPVSDLPPDYTKSVEDVYVTAAQLMLRNSVTVLQWAGCANRIRGDEKDIESGFVNSDGESGLGQLCDRMPSWAPDWRRRQNALIGLDGGAYQAASKSTPLLSTDPFIKGPPIVLDIDPSKTTIYTKAMSVSCIVSIKGLGPRVILNDKDFHERVIEIKAHYDLWMEKVGPKPVDDQLKMFACTILAGGQAGGTRYYFRETLSTPDLLRLWQDFEATPLAASTPSFAPFQRVGAKPRITDSGVEVFALSESYAYRMALRQILQARNLFVTTDGQVGLAPDISRPGDCVVLVAGLSVPLVVRPARGNEAGLHLIGECYLYGLMHGEIYNQSKSEDVESLWRCMPLV
ncbi:MAG: hypothetical protein OHK93_006928 [Ramalina farinacea]|uniref:Heterokaryon incompatibility domain-containing protein n=1 Tax=Ramalina farinacea TaxID=258253 RepID=A0AA43QKW4_9LECA|nr:hypothetical protein [Ramalina farinacea]